MRFGPIVLGFGLGFWRAGRAAVVAAAVGLSVVTASASGLHFYPDDPIAREPESQDASKTAPYQMADLYEMTYNLFVTSRYVPSGTRARNINTVDEVPDSSWFTNRIGTRPLTAADMTRGANVDPPPDPSRWVIIREKSGGAHPGFTARDASGQTWFLEFDPPSNPEGATGAVAVATKIFWALGYNQVESFITTVDPNRLTIDPEATMRRPSGAKTRFTKDDANEILEHVARNADGTYRAIAGRLLPGRILGGFLYAGARPDDPNDIVPHEHRRELRALRVFGAWTNLTDLKAANTLDVVVEEHGRSIVRHYLQDVGSTFGMCNREHEWDISWEHFYQTDATLRRLISFGFALSPWQTVDYVEYPATGKFEGERFDPRTWRPHTPTTAYMELRDDDAFWAARRVAAFTDDLIKAAVQAGRYSDPAAEQHMIDVLIERRDTIERVYLTGVNPLVNPRLDTSGLLTFDNAAVAAGVAGGSTTYRASWARFDNATGGTVRLTNAASATPQFEAPAGFPDAPGSFVAVDVAIDNDNYPAWRQPARIVFRRDLAGWTLVGLERQAAAARVSSEPAPR